MRVYDAHSLPNEYLVSASQFTQPAGELASSFDNDLIYSGDVLDVAVVSGIEESAPEPLPHGVDEQGNINVDLVGPVHIAGMTRRGAERAIREASIDRGIYTNPRVFVALNSRKNDKVRVGGAVVKPGVYEIPSVGNDLMAAVLAAGGVSEEAGSSVVIRHPPSGARTASLSPSGGDISLVSFPESTPSNAIRLDLQQGLAGDVPLHDGSEVTVEKRGSVFVMGLVKRPGDYKLPNDRPLRVLDAIATAGGRTVEIADKVLVTRYIPGRLQPVNIKVSVRRAKVDALNNLVLGPNDLVSVEETPTTFMVETLRGLFRFGFSSALPGT